MARDDVALGQEAWVGVGFVFPALDVYVGPELVEQFDSGGVGIDVNPINAFQRREVGRPKIFRNERPVNALIDLRIGADRDDQDIAERFSELEVMDVAGVNDVETAVAMHDGFALFAGLPAKGEEAIQRADFASVGHVQCQFSVVGSQRPRLYMVIGR